MNSATKFLDFLDSRSVFRRITLGITLWMTWRSFEWAATYAMAIKDSNDLQDAAIIAAVLAPIAYLQKAVFGMYSETRQPTESEK